METEKQNLSLLQIFKLCLLKLVCSHKWGKYADSLTRNRKHEIIKYEHTLICSNCGKIKRINL